MKKIITLFGILVAIFIILQSCQTSHVASTTTYDGRDICEVSKPESKTFRYYE